MLFDMFLYVILYVILIGLSKVGRMSSILLCFTTKPFKKQNLLFDLDLPFQLHIP